MGECILAANEEKDTCGQLAMICSHHYGCLRLEADRYIRFMDKVANLTFMKDVNLPKEILDLSDEAKRILLGESK